jgi:hypothetical protein
MYTPKASPFSLDYVPVTPINQVMLLANSIWRHVANPKGILRQMTDDSSLPEARKPQVQNYLKQMADNLGKEVLGGNSDYKGIYSLYNDEVSLALSLENRIQAAKITNNTMLSRTDIEDIIRRKPIQQLEPTDTRRTPVELVKTAAQDYNNSKRLPKIVDGIATKVRVSKTQARAIAAAYDKLKVDNSKDPKVKKAYEALGKEIQEQWDYATNEMGIEFIPRVGEGQPYANSAEMINDIRKNGRLFFFT